MEHSFLFLISSSINHFKSDELSIYDTDERFRQTIETIKSIKHKIDGVKICLFELSDEPIFEKYKVELMSMVDLYLDYHNDYEIKNIYENFYNNVGKFKYGKSLLELCGLIKTLKTIGDNNYFSDTTRVFKISGRYQLNKHFDVNDYKTKFLDNKYVCQFLEYNENIGEDNTHYHVYGNKGSMVTALWSFDRYLFNEVIRTLEKSYYYLQKMILYTNGSDIEHSIYHFIDKTKLINVRNLGVSVIKGMEFDNYDL